MKAKSDRWYSVAPRYIHCRSQEARARRAALYQHPICKRKFDTESEALQALKEAGEGEGELDPSLYHVTECSWL